MKKRRILSWFLCVVMICSLVSVDVVPAMAEESEEQQELTQQEIQEAWDSDVEIKGEDVPCQTVEWGEEETKISSRAALSSGDKSHQMVLVLDVSGSMSGTAMTELKKACNNFVDDILSEDPAAGIAIVTYASSVNVNTFSGKYFTSNRGSLRSVINSLSASGGTAMEAGLAKADEILQESGYADEKYIIQMADGEPNSGKTYTGAGARYPGKGYANAVYNTFCGITNDYFIYALGFFHNLSESGKEFPARFMNDIQNQAYYEVTDADELSFSFEEIAQNISSDQLILNKSTLTLEEGETDTLTVSFADSYTSDDKTVTWGSSDPSVATVNSSGVVSAVGEGTCTITAEAGGFKVDCPVTVTAESVKLKLIKRIVVYENQNGQEKDESDYVLSSEAVVTYNGEEYRANSSGFISFPLPDSGEIAVSRPGYVTRYFSYEQLNDIDTVYLQKQSDNPVINAIWVDGTDALVDDYEISLTKDSATSISVDVDWGASSRGEIALVQEAEKVTLDGNSLSMVLKNKFDVSKDVYVLATDARGHSVKQKIRFAVTNIEALDGAGLSFGSKINLTLPNNWIWVGGMDVSLDLAAIKAIPLEVSIDNGKVLWTVGIDVKKYTKEVNKTTNTNTGNSLTKRLPAERKNAFDLIKGTVTDFKKNGEDISKSINDIKNIKDRYKTAMNFKKSKYVIDMDFTVLGYGEGYIDTEGTYQWIDGGVILNPSGKVSWDGQYAIGPVPMYWEAAISAEITAKMNLKYEQSAKNFIPEGELGLSVKASAGTGVGINSVATAGGGATIRLSPSATFYYDKNNYYKLEAGISAYIKVKLGILEWQLDSPEATATLDNSAKTARSGQKLMKDMYDETQYTVQDLTYLADTQFGNMNTVSRYSLGGESYASIQNNIHSNSYEETNPQIVSLKGDTKLAVWVDCMTTDINDITLYYSYYDGTVWTDPAVVSDDNMADFSPDVCVSDGKAYIVWQNMETTFDVDDATLDAAKMAENTGISVAEFTPGTNQFAITELTEPNQVLDMQPTIQSDGNTVVVAWVRNTENTWYGSGTANSIITRTLNGSQWSDEVTRLDNLSSITSLAVDCTNGQSRVAYTMDGDRDATTINDTELYIDGQKMSEDEMVDSSVTFADHMLYWLKGNTLMCMDADNQSEMTQVLSEDVSISGEYQVVEEEEKKAILYTVPKEAGSEIYGVFWDADSEVWGMPMALTDIGSKISLFGAVWMNDHLAILCNSVDVNNPEEDTITENTYGDANLLLLDYQKTTSMDVVDCRCNSADIVVGSALPIYVTVANNGMQATDGVRVQIRDASGNIVEDVKFNQTISAGENTELEIKYLVKAEDIGKEFTVFCEPLGIKDYEDGQTGTIQFTHEELNLNAMSWGFADDKNALIYGYAENLGYSDLENITVDLYKDSMDGEPVDSVTIDSVRSMDSSAVKFRVLFEEGALYYLRIAAKLPDGQELDDSDYVYLHENQTVSDRTAERIVVSNKKSSYSVGDHLDMSAITVMVEYNDGTVSDVTKEATYDISGVQMNVAGTYNIVVSYENFKEVVTVRVAQKSSVSSGTTESSTTNKGTTGTTGGAVSDKVPEGYAINTVTGTATVTKAVNQKAASITIPSRIQVGNKVYPVTEISAKAFKNNKTLKKVVIPSTVTKIGKAAFQNCKNLKKITIKTKKLKQKTVGAKAFKGIYARAVFKLPKKQRKMYKKVLLKKGATQKMRFK